MKYYYKHMCGDGRWSEWIECSWKDYANYERNRPDYRVTTNAEGF